jgi:flavorubredoxin
MPLVYIGSNQAIKGWLKRIEKLDIKMIVPQQGKIYKGKVLENFLMFLNDLSCGVDLFDQNGLFKSED